MCHTVNPHLITSCTHLIASHTTHLVCTEQSANLIGELSVAILFPPWRRDRLLSNASTVNAHTQSKGKSGYQVKCYIIANYCYIFGVSVGDPPLVDSTAALSR